MGPERPGQLPSQMTAPPCLTSQVDQQQWNSCYQTETAADWHATTAKQWKWKIFSQTTQRLLKFACQPKRLFMFLTRQQDKNPHGIVATDIETNMNCKTLPNWVWFVACVCASLLHMSLQHLSPLFCTVHQCLQANCAVVKLLLEKELLHSTVSTCPSIVSTWLQFQQTTDVIFFYRGICCWGVQACRLPA